jgi:hypothetical protein
MMPLWPCTFSTEGYPMRTALALILAVAATLLVFAAPSPAAPDKDDLTGKWTCDDGGTYYVRQIGTDVWWTGKSGEPKDKKKAFANVFHGVLSGNIITGAWADDPAGEARGYLFVVSRPPVAGVNVPSTRAGHDE